jgi:signal transduction histidine kinase/ActR/RegA family two-component response regulator
MESSVYSYKGVSLRNNEEAFRLLAGASDLLSNCTDYEATIEMIANLLVSSLASWCAIDLLTDESKISRVAVAHRDPTKVDLTRQILLNYPAKPTAKRGVYRVIESGKSILIPVTPESMWAQRCDDPWHLQTVMDLGSTSYMCVPLIARGHAVGSIMLLSGERTYDENDLRTAEELAHRIAMAVDNVQMFRKMQQALKTHDDFLATLSHELRTPLNIIQGWIDILRSENLDKTSFDQAMIVLDRNSQLQVRMVNDLLDVARIEARKLTMELELVDLVKVLTTVTDSFMPTAVQKKISVQARIGTEPQMLLGDSSHLHRMALNLLSNAVKFTPSGGRVDLELRIIENEAVMTIVDTGTGIDSDFLPHVFKSFRQEDNTTVRVHGGLGLGLAISKHIVEQHRGNIVITSPGKGKGTEVTVRLPLHSAQEIGLGEKSLPHLGLRKKSEFSLKDVQILLVDDCEDIRILFARYLTKNGAQVNAVSSAAQALLELKKTRPDVLLSDIGMPEEDGYSLISKIRQLPADQGGKILAIAVTAYAREEERQQVLAAGFNAHLSKPIYEQALVENICGLLRSSESV